MKKKLFFCTAVFLPFLLMASFCSGQPKNEIQKVREYFSGKEFEIEEIDGIGFEEGVTRRDNSDVIKVGNKYYVYYTKVYGRSPGYWGSVWAALSEDEGFSWKEVGEILEPGKKGQWDSQAVFTPNILEERGTYYLYYTAVQPTPNNTKGEFENNSVNDYTAIGVAKATHPLGPFERCSPHPILNVSEDHAMFDSYRVDDAVLLKKDGKFRLYYKGRRYADGNSGPLHTQMGVAFADSPEGPFNKYNGNPILNKSHEVFLWRQNEGIACLASLSSTFEYSSDGLDFISDPMALKVPNEKRPLAPGAFRPELSGHQPQNELTWGISMIHNGASCYLVRWNLVDTGEPVSGEHFKVLPKSGEEILNEDTFRVITYNIWNGFNWGKDTLRHKQLQQWVKSQSPSVVALQELCAYTPEKLLEDAKAWGHKYCILLKESGYSVGLTSRYPIEVKEKIFYGLHHGALHCRTNGIDFLVVHLHPGSINRRREETKILLKKLEEIKAENSKYIVLGDFNAHSPFDADLYDPSGYLMNHVRKSNAGKGLDGNLVNDNFDYAVISGFLSLPLYDVTRKFTRGISERGSFPGRILGPVNGESEEQLLTRLERIDYILVSPELAPKCMNAKVCNGMQNWFLSDHYPVIAEFVGVIE